MNFMEKTNYGLMNTHIFHHQLKRTLTVIPILLLLTFYGCSKNEEIKPVEEPAELVVPDSLRIISYNILEGMKNDKANNYNKFVNWVKSYDPDILALQEVNGFKQADLEALALRYGHPYVITNLKASDNYPVAITSKYPLEARRRVTLHVSHGAIFARLKEKDLNIVVTHYWPQNYWHTQGDNLGNDYRLQETRIVLDSTIRKFPNEPNWILVGDFNSVSRKDYLPTVTTNNYWATDMIEEAGFMDAIHHLHGYKENNSAAYTFGYPGRRIDFLFSTASVLQKVIKAQPIYDDFTATYSDHPPMMMELVLR
jgi:exodeoxyribonuclease-3